MRVLFSCMGSLGHLQPAFVLAKELERRGAETAFITHEKMTDVVEAAGFRRIARGPQDGPSFFRPAWTQPVEMHRQIYHLHYAMETFKPDVLVRSELTMGPSLVKQCYGIPMVVIGMMPMIWPLECGLNWSDTLKKSAHRLITMAQKDLVTAFGELEVDFPAHPCFAVPGSPLLGDLYLLRSTPELQPLPAGAPDCIHHVGDLHWAEPAEEPDLQAWLKAHRKPGEKVIYVQHWQHPRINDFLPHLKEAVAGMPVKLIGSTQDDEPVVTDQLFLQKSIAHEAALPESDLVVALGTTSGALGALRHGLPLLLFPVGSEQPYIARRCREAGVAQVMNPRVTRHLNGDRIREALQALLAEDAPCRRKARELSHAVGAQGGAVKAADLVEDLVAGRNVARKPAHSAA